MHRHSMRAAMVLVAAATLTLAACGSKDAATPSTTAAAGSASSSGSSPASAATSSSSAGTSSAGTSSPGAATGGGLTIAPVVQIDSDGKAVKETAAGKPADPAGDGKAKCTGIAIGMAGALTGKYAALGQNILGGAKLAIDLHNKANADCKVELKQFDTEGDPQKATGVAPTIVSDASIIGLLGPAFSGETNSTGPTFNQANLLALTASATRVDLTANGWTNFFRGLANDGVQGPSVAKYLVNTKSFKHVCIVNDNQDYSVGLAGTIRGGLASAEDTSCASEVKQGDSDFSSTVSTVKGAADADAIFYAGYYDEAAKLVKQLRDGGVTIPFISADGTNDPQFVSQAGSSSKGAILSCPCGPATPEFAAAYTAFNSAAPGVYSVEGYDLTTIMLKGIDSGITTRDALVEYVKNYNGVGYGHTYKWDDKGELASSLIWIYEVK